MIGALLTDSHALRAMDQLRGAGDREALARAAWSVITEPGDGIAGLLIAHMGAAEALEFIAGDGAGLASVPPKELRDALARWRPRMRPHAVVEALTGAAEVGARLLVPGDADWPIRMDDLGAHAPQLLWVRGDASLLQEDDSVAIVGARAATGYGEHVTAELSGSLAASGTVVVSGGAYGVDGAAHRAALGVGGRTVALLAGGVDRPYPAGHRELFDRIIASGALVAETPCGTAPTKWRFLARNRLIAALGAATVVVEAGWRSGSLNTAGHAASLGRPLGAVPGPVTSATSAGCHRLLREYDARCVTTTGEVRELMGVATPRDAADGVQDNPDARRVRDALSPRSACSAADIAVRAGMSLERVATVLGLLRLDGEVERTEDGWRRAQASR